VHIRVSLRVFGVSLRVFGAIVSAVWSSEFIW